MSYEEYADGAGKTPAPTVHHDLALPHRKVSTSFISRHYQNPFLSSDARVSGLPVVPVDPEEEVAMGFYKWFGSSLFS